jgi:hypothetical protein
VIYKSDHFYPGAEIAIDLAIYSSSADQVFLQEKFVSRYPLMGSANTGSRSGVTCWAAMLAADRIETEAIRGDRWVALRAILHALQEEMLRPYASKQWHYWLQRYTRSGGGFMPAEEALRLKAIFQEMKLFVPRMLERELRMLGFV